MIANIAAATFGGLLKLYDDIEDIPVIAKYASSQFMEIVKVLIIASFTYAAMHNIHLPIIIFIAHCLHYLIADRESIATDFYHAGMILALLLSIITFDVFTLNMELIVSIIGFTLYLYTDHTLFPEEYSWKKITWRLLWVIGLFLLLQFPVPMSMPYYDLMFFPLGYCMISVLLMTCAQWGETPHEKDNSCPVTEKIHQDTSRSETPGDRVTIPPSF